MIKEDVKDYGKHVIVQTHIPNYNKTIYTLYAHLSEIDVKVNDQITNKTIVGLSGQTGNCLGSHLHFELRLGECLSQYAVNPRDYMKIRTS